MPERAATADEQQAVARALDAIVARYGDRLDEAGRGVLAARLLELQRCAAAVRAVAVLEDDEPVAGFAPHPARDHA